MKRIICLALCLILGICIVACSREKTLDAPALTLSDTGNATWGAQEGATGYEYKINDRASVKVDASVTAIVLLPGESIIVRALGDNEKYFDSEWSAPLTNDNATKLPKPVIDKKIIGSQIVLSWEKDARATSYKIRINNESEQIITENQYMISENDIFRLQAVGDEETYISSDWAIISPTPTH
ncbi:MAG: hypothetical protein E7622_04545 [Ruminococcaceae bacterium]|nr:hypothetical protein [Oscillospiraceae bacterium]